MRRLNSVRKVKRVAHAYAGSHDIDVSPKNAHGSARGPSLACTPRRAGWMPTAKKPGISGLHCSFPPLGRTHVLLLDGIRKCTLPSRP